MEINAVPFARAVITLFPRPLDSIIKWPARRDRNVIGYLHSARAPGLSLRPLRN